jgi:hypothetical protein
MQPKTDRRLSGLRIGCCRAVATTSRTARLELCGTRPRPPAPPPATKRMHALRRKSARASWRTSLTLPSARFGQALQVGPSCVSVTPSARRRRSFRARWRPSLPRPASRRGLLRGHRRDHPCNSTWYGIRRPCVQPSSEDLIGYPSNSASTSGDSPQRLEKRKYAPRLVQDGVSADSTRCDRDTEIAR